MLSLHKFTLCRAPCQGQGQGQGGVNGAQKTHGAGPHRAPGLTEEEMLITYSLMVNVKQKSSHALKL